MVKEYNLTTPEPPFLNKNLNVVDTVGKALGTPKGVNV